MTRRCNRLGEMMNPTETAAALPPLEALAALNAEATALRERLAEVERVRAATVTYLASMGVIVEPVEHQDEVEPADEPDTDAEPAVETAAVPTTRTIITETIGADAHGKLLKLLAPNRDSETTNITDLTPEHFRLGMRSPKSRTRTLCAAFEAWATSEPMMDATNPDIRPVVTSLALFMPPGASTVEVRRLIDGNGAAA